MPQTHIDNVLHFVFSTHERRPFIKEDLQPRLWAYMGGIAKKHDILPITIGGMDNHVHLLLALPSELSPAKAMQLIKGGSSKWFAEKHVKGFSWQNGFGGFSVSASLVPTVVTYIRNQADHHKKFDYKLEYLSLLKKHGVAYDPKYLW
ncbi:MAG TPA: transposase [Terriglobales bacterium]|nr:transposase [Terriglobales bacterium]